MQRWSHRQIARGDLVAAATLCAGGAAAIAAIFRAAPSRRPVIPQGEPA